MARDPAVAVIDIGKSNAKLALVDLATRNPIAMETTANSVVGGTPYPHFDVDRLWAWILRGLRDFAGKAEVTVISIMTHGACFALMAGDELALPVLDYEFAGPESVGAAYAKVRGPFSETLSPDLPNGLNAGRQIYWQGGAYPEAFAKTDAILPYPQYWAWRLSGVKATEVTSLGSHTDLWNPRAGRYSQLALADHWDALFAPLAKPWDTVGEILPSVARETGLSPRTRVIAGIHDSNASLLPHLLSRPQPFAVLSTGTWMIVLAPGGSLDGLDPERDCLANVDAFGHAVPSSRFMAGREFEIIAGSSAAPTRAEIEGVVRDRIVALPTFAPGTGPFGTERGRWARNGVPIDSIADLSPGARNAVASLYTALIAETCLGLAGAKGPIVVEGPFARNPLFLAALAQAVPRPVIARPDSTGTIEGAVLLALGPDAAPSGEPDSPAPPPLELDLGPYAESVRTLIRADLP